MYVQNYVIAGGRNGNPGSLSMSMEPVKLADGMGIAVKSIAYGELYNVTEINNSIKMQVVSPEVRSNSTETKDIIKISIPNGRYEIKEHILRAIQTKIDDYIESIGMSTYSEYESSASFGIRLKIPPFLKIVNCENETPIDLISAYFVDGYIIAEPGPMAEWTEMCFMYLNIVRSSYINGRKSRLLSVFPIHARNGYSYYEFTNPTYVPIEVREFSEITITLRNIKGSVLYISNKFDTVVSLHVKALKN
jgi:hypothetical protein